MWHHCDVIMSTMASQITSLTIVYSSIHSGRDKKNHQSSASLAFVRGVHRRPVNSPHKWPVTRKMFPIDDVIMILNKMHDQLGIMILSNQINRMQNRAHFIGNNGWYAIIFRANICLHYKDVTWTLRPLIFPSTRLYGQQFVPTDNKGNIKSVFYRPVDSPTNEQ